MASNAPTAPYRLMTVNTAPERAYRLIGRMTDALKGRYNIEHVGNAAAIEDVEARMEQLQPDVVFSASMWTPDEAQMIATIARANNPNVKTFAIPQGLQVERGPDAVVDFLIEKVPDLFDG